MVLCVILTLLCISAALLVAGAAKLERRAERWERYERFMHPPDDEGDGVTLLKEDDNADGR